MYLNDFDGQNYASEHIEEQDKNVSKNLILENLKVEHNLELKLEYLKNPFKYDDETWYKV